MKERPILFSGDMVRAILDGRKTQTRRPIKYHDIYGNTEHDIESTRMTAFDCELRFHTDNVAEIKCPFGQPGDRLWVRETWVSHDDEYFYAADCGHDVVMTDDNGFPLDKIKWRPSIHMPREASRILLEIDEIRVERVQGITEEDAKAEGIAFDGMAKCYKPFSLISTQNARCGFKVIWDFVYSGKGLGSETNPWVWVVKFHRIS
jgi:hypothetical protein